MESPRNFSLYIRIKNVCPLILNVTFVPFKDINLKRRKHLRLFGIKNPFNHFRPMFTGFKVTETLAHLNGILFTQDTLPKKHSSICLLMKFFSCPILADRVHTYFEIIHKYPGDNCPGYNGHWVGPSWVIVIIVTRHNCPLSSAAHLHIPPPLWHILDISSASKITRYKDPELDKQVSVTLSWHG